jgi:hypothetical protein
MGPPVGEELRAALGPPATVRRLPSSPRSRVWLVEFGGAPAIVKEITEGPDARDRFTREAAEPRGQLADACAGWPIRGDALVERARRGTPGYLTQLLHTDWSWGTATARQRLLHRLSAVAALAANHPALTSLGQVSQAMRDRILQRWPGTHPLPDATGDLAHNP